MGEKLKPCAVSVECDRLRVKMNKQTEEFNDAYVKLEQKAYDTAVDWAYVENEKKDLQSKMEATRGQAFDKGYVCAVTCLIAGHDQPTMANDVLRANLPDSWDYIDEYDKKILRDAGLLPKHTP